jgi:MFS family permease
MLKSALARVPGGVWVLGLVSLLMDASSELVHALLPLYMVGPLGASAFVVGLVEGVAESLALVVRIASGYLSDAAGRRKPLVLAGYALGAATKLVFPLAASLAWVIGARFVDRIGKGIRGAPRDALIADLAPPEARGASFGLRQALDTIGAILGPVLAVLALAAFAGDIRSAFWVAVVPAALCVALIVLGVREPAHHTAARARKVSFRGAGGLGAPFWFVTAVAAILTLARFSEAFLVLRAQSVGMPVASVPWVMAAMSAVYAVVAFPAGAWADHGHSLRLISLGMLSLIASDLVLAHAASPAVVIAGGALWGLHMALTQGLLSALVAAVAPPDLRGTAFGMFSLVTGVALLVASALAGWLWDAVGPRYTFYAGAAFTALAWLGLAWRARDLPMLSSRRAT